MKVWVVGRGYPTPDNGMWGSFELEQAKLLARQGYDVSYIALTLSFFDRKDPRGLRVFEEDNVHVVTYSHFYFPGKLGIYWKSFEDRCWRKLFDTAEKNRRPDTIHIHYPSMLSSINVVEEYRKQGVKLFVTEHWSRVLINNLKKHELARLKYYASCANFFASVGEPLQEAVKKLVSVTVPMTIIPNIVSPVFFEKRDVGKHPFTFICVGRVVPLKQFDKVIQKFAKQFAGNNDVRLVIIGSGSDKSNLESMTKHDNRITLTGELKLSDVAARIAQSDALISFSKYETFAAPVAEAWACGKPVIVSNTSGTASYVTEELGMVVSHDSPDELGDAMRRIYENQYDPSGIRKFAAEHFSDEAVMAKLSRMYAEGEK